MVLNSRSQTMPCFSFFAVQVSPSSSTILPKRMPRAYMFGIVITYSADGARRGERGRAAQGQRGDVPPSSGFPSSVTRFSPSIVVETLLPRNLDLGRSSPMMLTWFAGEM